MEIKGKDRVGVNGLQQPAQWLIVALMEET